MLIKGVFAALLLISIDALAAIGDGDKVDFIPIPGEFCNSESGQKQQALFRQYPKDMGIAKLYALYLGLCRLVDDGNLDEQSASMEWAIERDKLIEARKQ